MTEPIYRDALSAWRALEAIGGIERDDRDEDLVAALTRQLQPDAPDLETALAGVSSSELLAALFGSIQPSVSMFKDILEFFEQAGARQGKAHWRVSVDDQFLDFKHFEEFLEDWRKIEIEFDVPAIPRNQAFELYSAHSRIADENGAMRSVDTISQLASELPDVASWLEQYEQGQYATFPASLAPERFPPGLADAAALGQAAVSIVRRQGLSRDQMLEQHRARSYKSIDDDALHRWTIAQSETDYWLKKYVGVLAEILLGPEDKRHEIDEELAQFYSTLPRRRIPGKMDVKDLERLLSLPVWKQRYETYGVWVATRILAAVEDHDVEVHSDDGELKFAFREAQIADIKSSIPRLTLVAERRIPFDNPVGKGRRQAVQPDFGLWTQSKKQTNCVLVVEVKHYKRRSKRNFRDALIDYARAHPDATVTLVNYGPVGKEFDDLPGELADRCRMIGHLTPVNPAQLSEFTKLVRDIVGAPVSHKGISRITAVDVSGSMGVILASADLRKYLGGLSEENSQIALIDTDIRAVIAAGDMADWRTINSLGNSNALAVPVTHLLAHYEEVVVITDKDGMQDLSGLNFEQLPDEAISAAGGYLLRVTP